MTPNANDVHVFPVYDDEPEHVTDGTAPCWCEPYISYQDAETGRRVWTHRRTQ